MVDNFKNTLKFLQELVSVVLLCNNVECVSRVCMYSVNSVKNDDHYDDNACDNEVLCVV